jgi:hypothetical protein
MTIKPVRIQRPDFNLEAILALLGVLLGFLFIVVIYVLENPQEILSTWGFPLVMFLLVCYAIGLTTITSIISFEVNFYLTNKILEIDPDIFPAVKFEELKQSTQRNLRRSIRLLMFFIFSFGLFLINLASFGAAKIFYSSFVPIEEAILIFWGPIALLIVRVIIMFIVQFILIIPFAIYQGRLWDSFNIIEQMQPKSSKSEP